MFKAYSFLKRDFLIENNYRLSFLARILGVFFNLIIFYFIAKLLDSSTHPALADYGGSYFAFVLIGIAFSQLMGISLSSFANFFEQEQLWGTQESVLVTPTPLVKLIVYSSLWSILLTSVEILLYLFLGIFFFRLDLSQANWLGSLPFFVLTLLANCPLGIISASFIIVYKRGDLSGWLLNKIVQFTSGVYFPIAIFPGWLKKISLFLPFTYTLEGLRKTLLTNVSLRTLYPELITLTLFSAILLPLSFWILNRALKKAKQMGSLAQY
ncbi:MAG: ABC transporter permease [Elusimicrobiota bacterium]